MIQYILKGIAIDVTDINFDEKFNSFQKFVAYLNDCENDFFVIGDVFFFEIRKTIPFCYDLSLRQRRFAGNVCQSLRLAVWVNVQRTLGTFNTFGTLATFQDVSDVLHVPLHIYIVTSQIDSFFP